MANFRLERLFIILDEPVPGLDHKNAIDVTEFAWHGSDEHARSVAVTPLGDYTFAPFEEPTWRNATEGLATVQALRGLYSDWITKGTNPFGYTMDVLVTRDAVLQSVENVLTAAASFGRQFYLAARDLA